MSKKLPVWRRLLQERQARREQAAGGNGPAATIHTGQERRQRQRLEQIATQAEVIARGDRAGVLDALAAEWSVPTWTLDLLGIGWWRHDDGTETYTIPMVDGDRRIVGIMTRESAGHQAMMAGSRPGLYVPRNLDLTGTNPLFIVEDPDNVAALLAMGLQAIGRQSE